MQTIPSIDLYRELEVDPAASAETIDAAWKSLLKRHHPDVSPDAAASDERVKRLNLAHDWLSDPQRREMYDRSRPRAPVLIPRRPRRIATDPGEGPAPAAARGEPTSREPRAATAAASARQTSDARQAGAGGASPRESSRARVAAGVRRPQSVDPTPARSNAGGDSAPRRRIIRRLAGLILPIGLATIVTLVAISAYLGSLRGTSSNAISASGSVEATAGSSNAAVGSGAADPRSLALPNLAAQLPASCRNSGAPFSFELNVGTSPGRAFVVRCDAAHSYGPLVYVTVAGGWRLAGKVTTHAGYPYAAFSGAMTGRSPDEFGIAWTTGDGMTSTVTLYRVVDGVEAFWDSGNIGLAWSLARFTYQAAPNPSAPGQLIVVSADLTTGTRNCATCADHQMYRTTYAWDATRPTSVLRQTLREPYGLGP